MEIIGYIRTDFPQKFGIPRQSGLSSELKGVIRMEPPYRQPEAFRGLEGYSHIWLLWEFSENRGGHYQATVKPPRLGGNRRMGVFATRSPFRPNGIGLSCVRLDEIRFTDEGPLLLVSGVDMKDNTPILDIKPYIPYTDSHPDAAGGFSDEVRDMALQVVFPETLIAHLPQEKRAGALFVLSQDPRPGYQDDESRAYGVSFAGFDIRFTVKDGCLRVHEVEELSSGKRYRDEKAEMRDENPEMRDENPEMRDENPEMRDEKMRCERCIFETAADAGEGEA